MHTGLCAFPEPLCIRVSLLLCYSFDVTPCHHAYQSTGCNPLPMCHEHVTALDTDILSKSTEAPNAEIDIVEHCANTGNFDSANPVLQHLYKGKP